MLFLCSKTHRRIVVLKQCHDAGAKRYVIRRNTLITLTGKQNQFLDKIDNVSLQMNEIFYKGFSDDEITLFDSMLDRILKNCKNEEMN